ncbi:MAG: hypothetical protein IH959_02230 [Chloroflexi bacterium]|nr:hypothetical protein [Chloroflexota bacterium]
MSLIARIALFLGIIGALVALPTGGSASAQLALNVSVGDLWFCDASFQGGVCETTISVGDTISWDFSDAVLPHTTTACGDDCDSPTDSPGWDSGIINDGSSFEYEFDEPGTYLYRCNVHPLIMRGQIVVEAAAQPEPTEPADEPGDGDTPDVEEVTGVPATGQGPGTTSSSGWLLVAGLAAVAGVGLGATAHGIARRR